MSNASLFSFWTKQTKTHNNVCSYNNIPLLLHFYQFWCGVLTSALFLPFQMSQPHDFWPRTFKQSCLFHAISFLFPKDVWNDRWTCGSTLQRQSPFFQLSCLHCHSSPERQWIRGIIFLLTFAQWCLSEKLS